MSFSCRTLLPSLVLLLAILNTEADESTCCHPPIPRLFMCCPFYPEDPYLLVCQAISHSSLRPYSKSFTLCPFPDSSLPSGSAYHCLCQCYLHSLYIYLRIITLYCDALFIGLSSHLTGNTVEGLDHVYSFLHSQHLAVCLTLSKCMLNYKEIKLISNYNCRALYNSHIICFIS